MKIQTLNNNFLMGGVFFVTALFSHFSIADTTGDTTARVIKNSDNIAKNKGELEKAKSAVEIMADRVQKLAPLPHNERPREKFMWLCKDSDYPQWGGGLVKISTRSGIQGPQAELSITLPTLKIRET